MKFLSAIIVGLILVGCGSNETEEYTQRYKYETYKICFEGREFLVYDDYKAGGLTQIFGDDGKPVKCIQDKIK